MPVELLTSGVVLAAAVVYLAAAAHVRHRGDTWSRWRDVSFVAGCSALTYVAMGPLPGGPFTAHVTQHVVVAMAAPLLLVLARPLTLALRALSPGRPRRALLAVAHSRIAAVAVFPPLAALLDVGGLWLLYRTPLFAATDHRPLVHAVVHVHVLAAGLLFTFAVCQVDPVRRRWSPAWRGLALAGAGAAHAVLAKALYAAPPPHAVFATADLHAGAQLMYYAGDVVEVVLAAVIAVQWYRATGRAEVRRQRRPAGAVC